MMSGHAITVMGAEETYFFHSTHERGETGGVMVTYCRRKLIVSDGAIFTDAKRPTKKLTADYGAEISLQNAICFLECLQHGDASFKCRDEDDEPLIICIAY
jgi:hypothetical protein